MLAHVTRYARGAWSAVRRHPVISIAVVALVVLVATMLFMGREGWTFKGEKTELSEQHAKRIRELCATGMNFKQIQADPKFEQFSKYTENAAWKACEAGFKVREEGMKSVESGAFKAEQCKTGKLCPVLTLRATRPCLNQDGKRCCTQKNSRCRPMQLAGQSNFQYTDKKWAEEDKAKFGDNPVVPWNGCDYVGRVADNGQWVCPKQYQHATDVEKLAGIDSQSPEQRQRQCAKSPTCANKLKKHYQDNPIVPAAANGAQGQGAPVQNVAAVVLFKDADYKGSSVTLGAGSHNLKDHSFNDAVTSIQVPAGTKLTVYDDSNNEGHSWTVPGPANWPNTKHITHPGNTDNGGKSACKGGINPNSGCWNDRISSIKVEAA